MYTYMYICIQNIHIYIYIYHIVEYYSAIKRNKVLIHTMKWMNFKNM